MKTELIAKLTANRDELLNLLADLNEEQITTISVVGGWTIKDAVGHVSYWEQVIHDHVRESFSEGKPHPQQRDELDDIVNPREATKRKDWSWQRVRAEFEDTRRALIERVENLSETELAFIVPNPWWNETNSYPVGRMIESDAIGHAREHIEQIKSWKTKFLSSQVH
jgi:hypothetical protein